MEEISICLSFFDEFDGPRVIWMLPKENQSEHIFISQFFDFHKTGEFFTHIFNDQLSFNYLFNLEREKARGGSREFMLSSLVSLEILRKRDLLQYYPSIKDLFKNWQKSLASIPEINPMIVDGKETFLESEIKPIIMKLDEFLEELHYLIDMMPEVMPVPANRIH